MPSWRDDKILELANQLTYSNADKRREQLQFVIDLLPDIDAAKSYPWDFIHFRITSFQPRTHIDHAIPGKILRSDLAALIEFLSDTLSIRVEEAAASGDAVLELDDVTRKFSVSSKTIQRWRKQGLIAMRYLYADGRRRLGFLESAVTRFAADNKSRVERSANFKQLTDEEKSAIIDMARRLAAQGNSCIKDISRCVARHAKRSPETIRYTIRRYDREHPETAIFPEYPLFAATSPNPGIAIPGPTPENDTVPPLESPPPATPKSNSSPTPCSTTPTPTTSSSPSSPRKPSPKPRPPSPQAPTPKPPTPTWHASRATSPPSSRTSSASPSCPWNSSSTPSAA